VRVEVEAGAGVVIATIDARVAVPTEWRMVQEVEAKLLVMVFVGTFSEDAAPAG
jgi:hypothetical protein